MNVKSKPSESKFSSDCWRTKSTSRESPTGPDTAAINELRSGSYGPGQIILMWKTIKLCLTSLRIRIILNTSDNHIRGNKRDTGSRTYEAAGSGTAGNP